MSWALFKNNILKYANNPNSLPDLNKVAKLWTTEYDAAIKRGYDTVNFVKVKQGNTKLMEELVYAALLKGQSSKQPYDLVGELGKAVQAYWTGAVLNETPIPIIPAPGTIANIAVTSNVVINAGTWTPPQQSPAPQTDKPDLKEDFEKYKETVKTFDEIFRTTIIVYDNRQPTPTQIIQNVIDYKRELEVVNPGDSGTSDGAPLEDEEETKPKPKIEPIKGDKKLYDAVGSIWPALGEYGNFEVDIPTTKKQAWYKNKGTKAFPLTKMPETSTEINEYLQKTGGKGVRVWYKTNPEYIKQNCDKVYVPTASGDVAVVVHKQLKTLVDPVFKKIKEKKLEKYISNCGGGIAIRNVTDGLRLSNHSWGLAIDMNTVIYPIGTKFATDGIYEGKTKIRDYNDFDLGFIKVTKLFTDEGMTWLKSFDPMHVSIYE
jgi:hypothetical protein